MEQLFFKDGFSFCCESQGTRYGFRHLCYVFKDGQEVAFAKRCYYNRTWERWEFESVLNDAAQKVGIAPFTDEDRWNQAA